MSTLKFEIATADKEAAESGDAYHLKVFDLEGEKYAAVRPADSSFLSLMRHVYVAKQDERNMAIAGIKFLDQCFVEDDLRAALIESEQYDDVDEDGDGELSAAGLELTRSNQRINDRLMDRHDVFGYRTLVAIMEGLSEEWSGNPTGSQPASSSGPRRTGARSTGRSSSKASTSRKPSTRARRGS